MADVDDDKILINLKIGKGTYAMHVKPVEEKSYREAASYVSKTIELYDNKFPRGYSETQRLTMIALDFAHKFLALRDSKDDSILSNKIEEVVERIDQYLKREE